MSGSDTTTPHFMVEWSKRIQNNHRILTIQTTVTILLTAASPAIEIQRSLHTATDGTKTAYC